MSGYGGGYGRRGGGRGGGGGGRGGGGRGGGGGGGRGRGGGGARWADPAWREQRLREIRAERGEDRLASVDMRVVSDRIQSFLKLGPHEEEIQLREAWDLKAGMPEISRMAANHGLHARLYGKGTDSVVVISRRPLPNYRADLDARKGSNETDIHMSVESQRRVQDMLDRVEFSRPQKSGSRQRSERGLLSFEEKLVMAKDSSSSSLSSSSHSQATDSLNQELKQRMMEKMESREYKSMLSFRKKLPSYSMAPEVVETVQHHQVTVISGETGCGKTTQVPQFILESEVMAGRGAKTSIVVTQPRRISAVSIAERVAQERGEPLGETVGYQIRLEKTSSSQTKLLFCTTGVLLRRLINDPGLTEVSHIIVDEIHERGINEDFLLIILKEVLHVRPDLRVLLMSATINAESFSRYFGNAPNVHIPGFTFPVQPYFLEDFLEMSGYEPQINQKRGWGSQQQDDGGERRGGGRWGNPRYRAQMMRDKQRKAEIEAGGGDPNKSDDNFEAVDENGSGARYSNQTKRCIRNWEDGNQLDIDLLCEVIKFICSGEMGPGAVLVFLTGWEEITKTLDALKSQLDSSRAKVLPLHGSLSTSDQREVFKQPPKGVRKIILSTNIAETSITIDDIVFVVNCGKSKETKYDPVNKICELGPQWTSKASMRQRSGRAGRVQAGIAFHVFPRMKAEKLADFQEPEMLRTPLEGMCLHIKALGVSRVESFLAKAPDPPSPIAVSNALELLKAIGAMKLSHGQDILTPLGRHLSQLPVDPRVGKMLLLGAIFGCLSPILTIAAGLAYRDPFVLPIDKKEQADEAKKNLCNGTVSDHFAILNAYEGWIISKETHGWSAARSFCWENFLSQPTLELIHDMRSQFYDLLRDIGFVDRESDLLNRNSDNISLVRGVILAGMYPSVATIDTQKKRPQFRTKEDGRVELHPTSVNARTLEFPYRWLAYSDKVKTASIYLRENTMISDYALLLLGGRLDHIADGVIGMENGYMRFYCKAEVSKIIDDLRYYLDELLQEKIENPRMRLEETGENLVQAVIELLREEEREFVGENQDSLLHTFGRSSGQSRGGGGGGGGGYSDQSNYKGQYGSGYDSRRQSYGQRYDSRPSYTHGGSSGNGSRGWSAGSDNGNRRSFYNSRMADKSR